MLLGASSLHRAPSGQQKSDRGAPPAYRGRLLELMPAIKEARKQGFGNSHLEQAFWNSSKVLSQPSTSARCHFGTASRRRKPGQPGEGERATCQVLNWKVPNKGKRSQIRLSSQLSYKPQHINIMGGMGFSSVFRKLEQLQHGVSLNMLEQVYKSYSFKTCHN